MPELPEVETIRRDLARHLPGRRIESMWTSGKPLRMNEPLDVRALRKMTVGKKVTELRRRAKYLLMDTDAGGAIVVHLGMTGKLWVAGASSPKPPHTHIVWRLDDGRELRYTDARRFGFVTAVHHDAEDDLPALAVLGVDPLDKTWKPADLGALMKRTKRGAKAFLMDQGRVAGLGNIYVCEALYRAGIHPAARSDLQKPDRVAALHEAIVQVLMRGIENRGTTLRDYTDGDGNAGRNQHQLFVYGREDKECRRCKTPVRRIVQQNRSTFFCPACQTLR